MWAFFMRALKYPMRPNVQVTGLADQREETWKTNKRERSWRRGKTKTLTGEEFIRGFLQHVLPRSFQKVPYYGLPCWVR